MPATATLTDDVSTAAFTVPAGALGFVLWNKAATELRVRVGAAAAVSGPNEGLPLPAGDASPQYFTHYFDRPLALPVAVHIHQASGGNLTEGVGYDVITR